MYDLEFDSTTILQRLKTGYANGVLEALIPNDIMSKKLSIKGPGRVQIVFRNGEIIFCELSTPYGFLTQEKRILSLLERAGVLRWKLTPSAAGTVGQSAQKYHSHRSVPLYPTTQPLMTTPTFLQHTVTQRSVPRKLHIIDASYFSDLSIRVVYQLIDGRKSVGNIAAFASLDVARVILIIQWLNEQGITAS